MPLPELSLAEWTSLLASRKPVPAGGALSLVTLAGASALAAKVLRLRGVDPAPFEALAREFLAGAEEDAEAYREACGRGGVAVTQCLETGLEHLDAAAGFLEALAEHFAGLPEPLAADLAACARLAWASAQTLLLNLAVNLAQWGQGQEWRDQVAGRIENFRARLQGT